MSASPKRTVELTPEQDAFIEAKISDGAYPDAGAVIRDALEALQAHETVFEPWMEKAALKALEALERDPSSGIPAETVFAELRARNAARRAAE